MKPAPSWTSRADRRARSASASASRADEEAPAARRVPDDEISRPLQLRRSLGRGDGDPHRQLEPVEPAEGVEVGCVVAGVERASQAAPFEQRLHGGALVGVDRGSHLEHLASELRP